MSSHRAGGPTVTSWSDTVATGTQPRLSICSLQSPFTSSFTPNQSSKSSSLCVFAVLISKASFGSLSETEYFILCTERSRR
eukprot:scaffold1699_cov252-Ochromonas_danica.AAC.14